MIHYLGPHCCLCVILSALCSYGIKFYNQDVRIIKTEVCLSFTNLVLHVVWRTFPTVSLTVIYYKFCEHYRLCIWFCEFLYDLTISDVKLIFTASVIKVHRSKLSVIKLVRTTQYQFQDKVCIECRWHIWTLNASKSAFL